MIYNKDCDPRCTGRCNKKRFSPVPTTNKGCDPKCTGPCSKKNAWTSHIENLPPALSVEDCPLDTSPIKTPPPTFTVKGYTPVTSPIEQKDNDFIKEINNETQSKFLQPGDVHSIIMDLDGVILGIENLMDYFTGRKIEVAVASSCNKESFKLKTQKHRKFFKKFNHIVLGGTDAQVDARKPSPTIYKVCGSRFPSNPDPKRVLVLEDAPEGVASAIAAQMNVVWFPNKYMNKENNLGALAVLHTIEAFDPQQFGLPPIKR